MYDTICDLIAKLMRRFMKTEATERKYGLDLAAIKCKDVTWQLADKDVVIGDRTRKLLKTLLPDQQKNTMLGIRSFFSTTASFLQGKLPLSNQLLRELGCLNPAKRKKDSTVTSIESIASKLQPNISTAEVIDEWKIFQIDTEIPDYDATERIDVFWKQVFTFQGSTGENRYQLLPIVVKSGLVLAVTNAE